MKRLSRLTNILLHLQAKRVVTSQELADKFDISQRTVYRDIKALEEAGVPVIGEAGSGYSLMDNYRIPPIMFSEQEMNALITTRQLLGNNSDASLIENFDTAITKVKALLRHAMKEKSEFLEDRIMVLPGESRLKTEYLAAVQCAIADSSILKLEYHAIHSDTTEARNVEPLAIYFAANKWILIGHCRLRNALREFRLDRILTLKVSSESFTMRPFSFDDYISSLSQN